MKTTNSFLKRTLLALILFGLPNPLFAQLTITITPTPITCFGAANGHAEAVLTGGTPPFTFTWSTGDTTPSIQNLAPGIYSLTVTDTSQDSATAATTLTQPAPLGVNVSGQSQLCAIAPDGVAVAIPYGGTTPYTYLWSNGSNTMQINNLVGGIYTATVTDAHGCTVTSFFDVGFWKEGVFSYALTNDTPCGYELGSITLTYLSGTAPYDFQWSNGATTQDLVSLAAGDYSLTVSDAHGCVGHSHWDIQTLYPPVLAITLPEPLCFHQTAMFSHEVSADYPHILWQLNNSLDQIIEGQGTDSISVHWNSTGAKTIKMQFGVDSMFCGTIEFLLTVAVCAGTVAPELENVQISPNPFSDYLQVDLSDEFPDVAKATLTDLSGKTVLQNWINRPTTTIPTTDLPPGIYLLKVNAGNTQKVVKVLKMPN